jgi:hypothetical protein
MILQVGRQVLVWTVEHVLGSGIHLAVLMVSCALHAVSLAGTNTTSYKQCVKSEVLHVQCSELPCRGAAESYLVSST